LCCVVLCCVALRCVGSILNTSIKLGPYTPPSSPTSCLECQWRLGISPALPAQTIRPPPLWMGHVAVGCVGYVFLAVYLTYFVDIRKRHCRSNSLWAVICCCFCFCCCCVLCVCVCACVCVCVCVVCVCVRVCVRAEPALRPC
jgi:hypothetical protein